MDIEKVLREYKKKKSSVETTLARIDQYKFAIAHPEMWYKDYIPEGKEPGMPGKPRVGYVSDTMTNYIIGKDLTIDILKDWVKDDESRIFIIKLEVEQIEKALDGLTSQEKYIIQLKYFEKMFWKDIELNFNVKFRQKNYITYEMLKKSNKEALDKLEQILSPFYNQFRVA